jgi:dihydroorotate dehydrogenase (NAD+) catalytic subunit
MSLTIPAGKLDLTIEPVCMNVAGTLGFSDEAKKVIDLSLLGALITNPISISKRVPARPPRVIEFKGGFLLHTGHPNQGLKRTLQDHVSRWSSMPCPVVINALVQSPDEAMYILDLLEDEEPVAAVEIGLGEIDAISATEIISSASQSELPIIANAPLNVGKSVFQSAAGAGASAISLGPPRGSIRHTDGKLVNGRIFGPSVLPFALRAISSITDLVDVPIISSGGVYRTSDVKAMIDAGAAAVQLDSVLWTDPREIFSYFHDENAATQIMQE